MRKYYLQKDFKIRQIINQQNQKPTTTSKKKKLKITESDHETNPKIQKLDPKSDDTDSSNDAKPDNDTKDSDDDEPYITMSFRIYNNIIYFVNDDDSMCYFIDPHERKNIGLDVGLTKSRYIGTWNGLLDKPIFHEPWMKYFK